MSAEGEQPERVLIAEVDGHVVGFAAIGPSGDEDGGGDGEVRAMYLIAGHWGQGIGRALMGSALDALRQAGFTEATLLGPRHQGAGATVLRGGWTGSRWRRQAG